MRSLSVSDATSGIMSSAVSGLGIVRILSGDAGARIFRENKRADGTFPSPVAACGSFFLTRPVRSRVVPLILLAERLSVGFAIRIKELFAAFVPGGL
jgi:hypothetical protein